MTDKAKWVFLLALGGLSLNWPFLSIFDRVLPHYLFGVWMAIIVAAVLLSELSGRGGQG